MPTLLSEANFIVRQNIEIESENPDAVPTDDTIGGTVRRPRYQKEQSKLLAIALIVTISI